MIAARSATRTVSTIALRWRVETRPGLVRPGPLVRARRRRGETRRTSRHVPGRPARHTVSARRRDTSCSSSRHAARTGRTITRSVLDESWTPRVLASARRAASAAR
jgi:hypothetical protein